MAVPLLPELFAPDDSLFSSHNPSHVMVPKTPAGGPGIFPLQLPVSFVDGDRNIRFVDPSDPVVFEQYLKSELDVSRLNCIHKHLWFAGLPIGARPLHQQVFNGRKLVVTERADLHLLWHDDTLFIKPLPDFLFVSEIWTGHLCRERELYEDAKGFLLSYFWLICSKSDLIIAHNAGLLSPKVEWEHWTSFIKPIIKANLDKDKKFDRSSLLHISPRYLYGDLRLARINFIYRFCSATLGITSFFRGYKYGYQQYSTFLERNFAWLAGFTVYIALVLTAMQVGLGTSQLKSNTIFNNASYGFTVFSILGPLIAIFMIAVVFTQGI